MGMAASQARFLGLTARKSNTEYEGQQVNQQRTALANQSAGLFNKMLALEVPTPPSATNYYSIRYTYTDEGSTYEILSQTPQANGKYTVRTKYTYSTEVPVKTVLTGTYKKEGETYYYNGNQIELVTDKALQEEIGASSDQFYSYTNEEKERFYITEKAFQEVIAKLQSESSVSLTKEQYKKVAGTKSAYQEIKDATFDSDSSGRLTTIHYQKIASDSTASDGTNPIYVNVDKTLTMTEVQDSAGYDQAMQQYYYKKEVYDKTIEDINAKTSIIQQQDRTLELRLKQLDTEQKALNDELEAVKKVIQTNVDATFKTFA